jgi:hypothetical protein
MEVGHAKHIAAAPDGSNCVTIVATPPSQHPMVVISQYVVDDGDQWHPTGSPLQIHIAEVPDLINMLDMILDSGPPSKIK